LLRELHIENVAVIERADLELGPGLNILTGETGAGKSILVDAMHAILGARVSRELVRTGAEKAVVCAAFDPDPCQAWCEENEIECDDELIIRRQITAEGKTSCRVCGVPVTTAQLRTLGALLLDIHGQNDGQHLLDEREHLRNLDRFGQLEPELAHYREQYRAYQELCKERDTLLTYENEKELLTESLRRQIEELERVELKAGEEAELTERSDLLRNFEKLSEAVDQAYDLLAGRDDSASALAGEALSEVERAANYASELVSLPEAVKGAVFTLQDAAETLRDFRDGLDFSDEEFDRIETRLSLLRRLERKYNTDEAGLIDTLEAAQTRLDQIEYAGDRLQKLESLIQKQTEQTRTAAAKLTQARQAAAAALERELRELSMPSARFRVEITPLGGDPGFQASGADNVRFLISANTGEALGRISKIASGGELSRIMLALKNVFAERDDVPSMVFDEVDAGVSGVAAQRVGEKLSKLSATKQVICITHLPQIAAMADQHYLIEKCEQDGRTRTTVQPLDSDGRQREIARLYGGDHITPLTLASAAEQLASAAVYKQSLKKGERES
jgi:DNA repair protein RecN (Recombination protein N)